MRQVILSGFSISVFSLSAAAEPLPNPLGIDMGCSPAQAERSLSDLGIKVDQGTWLRIRGMAGSKVIATTEVGGQRSDTEGVLAKGGTGTDTPRGQQIEKRRDALAALRGNGHQLVAMIRWSNWEGGTRPTPARLPLDLREAYQRCRDLAFTYGELIDAWEIDNEPDISFVPENAETFAAFYKACSLGILTGREQAQAESRGQKSENGTVGSQLAGARAPSAIMHSPMALPPGPYWHELVANDVLSYTEAFNYHFYGYPEDFRGVRDAWVGALRAAMEVGGRRSVNREETNPDLSMSALSLRECRTSCSVQHVSFSEERLPLPLFLTEYGYGLLDRYDRFTIEGRERQKSFFELTLPSITDGTITGAMAFVFMPYYERGMNEFGLLAEVPEDFRPVLQEQQGENVPDESAGYEGSTVNTPASKSAQKPLDSRSHSIGGADTFPLLTDGNLPSPVVIDFIAGDQTQSVKRYNGHLLRRVEDLSEGNADVARQRGDGATERSRPEGVTQSVASKADEKQNLKTETLKSGSNKEGEDGTTELSRPERVTQSIASKADKERNLQSTSGGEFTLVLYNFSDEPVTGVLRLSLENGQIAETKPAGRQPGLEDAAIADIQTTEAPDQSADMSAEALAKEEASAKEEKTAEEPPPPYQRPDVPRSSLRPPEERTWPNGDTRIISTESGKTYAITPALEMLLQAAEAGGRMSEVRNRADATGEGEEKPEAALPMGISPNAVTSDEATGKEEVPAFVSNPITLAPIERREFKFTATLPNQEFRPHRMTAIWLPVDESNPSVATPSDTQTDLQTFSPDAARRDEPANHAPLGGKSAREKRADSVSAFQHFSFQHFEARLATQLYPSPAAFRLRTINAFDFTAEDNANARARQLARPRAEGEARLYQHLTAQRWLSTPGVHIEETFTGWRITVNDLPPEPLRPAEIELPLPADWQLPAGSALSLKYRLIPPETPAHDDLPTLSASPTPSHLPTDSAHAPNRFEEFDLNLRDTNGTLWSVWPRLFARREPQTYLEPLNNFTPMFFSRAPAAHRLSVLPKGSISASERFSVSAFSQNEPTSLVLLLRPRTLPTTIEITFPKIVTLDRK